MFINALTQALKNNADADNAAAMAAYMKNRFLFYGIKTPGRRAILKSLLIQHKNEIKAHPREIALELYNNQQREYHYCAVEILITELKKNFLPNDITLIEKLIVTHSWWDTVDIIAKYLLGGYLKNFPEKTESVINTFSSSDDMWLNRSAILFQLDYKKQTNEALLFAECLKHKDSKDFFIQKAIGWALREYGKTNPEAVRRFVAHAILKPLSTREALKNL